MVNANIENPFRSCRMSLDLTQKQLAEKLGVSETTVRNIESGRKGTSLEIMKKTAEVFGRPVQEVFPNHPFFKIL
ncbi:helix-turn-helix transcriptional regulator [Paenibacillus sp. RC84]|uniref:helix-turn-helix transcriptional regulator n=1 Tax=Paenibacillus sp. RC84 TaxID=3156252 RepID=UPI0035172A52